MNLWTALWALLVLLWIGSLAAAAMALTGLLPPRWRARLNRWRMRRTVQ